MGNRKAFIISACFGALGGLALQGADVTTTGGTTNDIPVFTGSTAVGNSLLSQSGSTVTVSGSVNATGSYSIGGSTAVAQSGSLQSVAVGSGALAANTGDYNVAAGWDALNVNTTGKYNVALGYVSLLNNTTGLANTAVGDWSLHQNSTGGSNTMLGEQAGYYITTGSNNIGVGTNGGYSLTTGNYNIDIGNQGLAADSGVIRIGGAPNQTSAFIAGIYGVTTGLTGAVDVVVDSNGQLGTKSSSLRYKEDVQNMDDASSGLLRLRPVTFRYKQPYADGSKPIDYGLIAEEVADVYPDLVSKNSQGQVETVQYSKLTPMLVNELQKQRQLLERQAQTIQLLEERLAALEAKPPAAR